MLIQIPVYQDYQAVLWFIFLALKIYFEYILFKKWSHKYIWVWK